MKLFGNRRKKKGRGDGAKKPKAFRVLRTFIVVVVVIMALAVAVTAAWKIVIQPPERSETDPPPAAENTADLNVNADPGEPESEQTGRKDGIYTLLIAGEDEDNGGADVVMLVFFDTDEGKIDILSIPRDTLVNVSWGTKKINSYKNYYNAKQYSMDYDQWVDALKDGVKKIVGYEPDSYVTVDMDGFVELVEAIGGVYYDVPHTMKKADENIYVSAGPQLLDGQNALGVVRFRDYVEGDIERIQVQQGFIKALLGDLLQAENVFKINALLDIYNEYVDTDLTYRNLAWYVDKITTLGISGEDINFYSIGSVANTTAHIKGVSYVAIYMEQWLELLNDHFNPFYEEIMEDELDILTYNDAGTLYATSGVIQGENTWDWAY